MHRSLLNLFLFCFVIITISSVNQWSSFNIGNTTIWWLVNFFTIILIVSLIKKYYNKYENPNIVIWPVVLYLLWNLTSSFRGLFIAEDYWEWKTLIDKTMFFLLPVIVYIAMNKFIVQKMVSIWIKYALLPFFLFLPFFIQSDAVGNYLVPIMFLLLFFPILPTKWKVIVLFFVLVLFISGLDARSNIIKFSISFIISLVYYFRRFIRNWMFKFVHGILIFIPFFFFGLAITDTFNIFKMNDYIDNESSVTVIRDGEEVDEKLTGDTRTFLYVEVINSAIENQYTFFGRTPSRGYDSDTFGEEIAENLGTNKKERFACEVSILNIFTWTGLIGVVLYFIVFLRASKLAIYNSNNIFIKIIGVFVAFRWNYAFVEDFSRFDLSYIFLWILISMCYSNDFRKMSDFELFIWIRGIFYKKFALSKA